MVLHATNLLFSLNSNNLLGLPAFTLKLGLSTRDRGAFAQASNQKRSRHVKRRSMYPLALTPSATISLDGQDFFGSNSKAKENQPVRRIFLYQYFFYP